jgi:hypothetical protein
MKINFAIITLLFFTLSCEAEQPSSMARAAGTVVTTQPVTTKWDVVYQGQTDDDFNPKDCYLYLKDIELHGQDIHVDAKTNFSTSKYHLHRQAETQNLYAQHANGEILKIEYELVGGELTPIKFAHRWLHHDHFHNDRCINLIETTDYPADDHDHDDEDDHNHKEIGL